MRRRPRRWRRAVAEEAEAAAAAAGAEAEATAAADAEPTVLQTASVSATAAVEELVDDNAIADLGGEAVRKNRHSWQGSAKGRARD